MKRLAIFLTLVFIMALALPVFAGNGAMSGLHYNLNLLGKEDCKDVAMTGSNRHTIFVLLKYSDPTPKQPTPLTSLDSRNKIFLQASPPGDESFKVIDGNACDGALFQLPQNSCDTYTPVETGCDYYVFIRGLGSPKDNPYADMTSCRIDYSADPDVYQCSTETVRVERKNEKSTFQNVTKELTTLCLDTSGDNICDTRVLLFTENFYKYFWDYDNNGLRLAQLRFYPAD